MVKQIAKMLSEKRYSKQDQERVTRSKEGKKRLERLNYLGQDSENYRFYCMEPFEVAL